MNVSLVVAMATNNVIGRDGGLPWHLPEDLQYFKSLTMGKPIVMGRKTYDSIGRALPGRQNVVLTRDPSFSAASCDIAKSRSEVFELTNGADEIMVIGGASIYELFLPQASRIYLTRVSAIVEGDTWFPPLDESEWRVTDSETFEKNAEREFGFELVTLERQGGKSSAV